MLILDKFQKKYAGQLILDIPHLELSHGIYWVKGANGSGKSTLFKILAGLLPFEGNVRWGEVDMRRHPLEYRQWVNYGEAEPNYPVFLTGHQLIQFVAKARKADPQAVQSLIDVFQIGQYIHRAIGTYSSGMCKKLSLVLALTGQPKLLLLDEPLITMDAAAIEHTLRMIRQYYENGCMILISSHQSFDNPSDMLVHKTLFIQHQTIQFV